MSNQPYRAAHNNRTEHQVYITRQQALGMLKVLSYTDRQLAQIEPVEFEP